MESLKGQFLVAMPGMGDERFHDTVDLRRRPRRRRRDGAGGQPAGRGHALRRYPRRAGPRRQGRTSSACPPRCATARCCAAGRCSAGAASCCTRRTISARRTPTRSTTRSASQRRSTSSNRWPSSTQPADAVFALGYCGWAAGQLENELALNGWLTVPFSRDLLFGTALSERYDIALGQLGITRASLSGAAGHA